MCFVRRMLNTHLMLPRAKGANVMDFAGRLEILRCNRESSEDKRFKEAVAAAIASPMVSMNAFFLHLASSAQLGSRLCSNEGHPSETFQHIGSTACQILLLAPTHGRRMEHSAKQALHTQVPILVDMYLGCNAFACQFRPMCSDHGFGRHVR